MRRYGQAIVGVGGAVALLAATATIASAQTVEAGDPSDSGSEPQLHPAGTTCSGLNPDWEAVPIDHGGVPVFGFGGTAEVSAVVVDSTVGANVFFYSPPVMSDSGLHGPVDAAREPGEPERHFPVTSANTCIDVSGGGDPAPDPDPDPDPGPGGDGPGAGGGGAAGEAPGNVPASLSAPSGAEAPASAPEAEGEAEAPPSPTEAPMPPAAPPAEPVNGEPSFTG